MNKRKIIIVSVVSVVVVLIAVIVFAILSGDLFGKKSGFVITNMNEYLKSADNDDKKSFLNVVANQIRNVSGIDLENVLVEGTIRGGSYNEEKQNSITTATFLLDIDAIEQTYAITFPWSESVEIADGIMVECPKNNLSKFSNNYCVGIYTTSASIEIYLPYNGNVDGNKYSVYTNFLVDNGLDLFVTACGDEKIMNAAKNDFENWIDNTNFLENIYNINVVDICTQFN